MRYRWLVAGLLLVALLVPAVALTALRLGEATSGLGVRLVAFTPFAVVLYGVAVLLLLLLAAVRKDGWRTAAVVAAVLLLPPLGLHLWWVSGQYVGGPAASAEGEGRLTVMTTNLLQGRADPASVVTAVHDRDVDVLVMVEVTPAAIRNLRLAGLTEELRFRTGEAVDGFAGTVVMSRHPLRRTSALDTTYRGYVTRVVAPGGTVDLVAVHPFPPFGEARQWRSDHRKVLRAAIGRNRPTVVAGDLNATPDHQPVRELAARGFTSAAMRARSGWQPTWPAAGEKSLLGFEVPSVLQLDHVLVDDALAVLDTETVTIPETDHRAVVARLQLP
jgi:endonuclease/exonuclease/phosphatase (EEP) superfamily protein YafD